MNDQLHLPPEQREKQVTTNMSDREIRLQEKKIELLVELIAEQQKTNELLTRLVTASEIK